MRGSGEFRAILRIGLPVAATQLSFMSLGIVDTALLGHRGELELAASAIANMWSWGFVSLAVGLVLGADPFISQAFGRGERDAVALALQRALLVALGASIPAGLATAFTEPALVWLGQPADVAHLAGEYNLLRLPSVPAFLVFVAQRIYLQGRNETTPAMWVGVLANVQNLVLGWALIFGRWGLPEWGLRGAALVATLTSLSLPLYLAIWLRLSGLLTGYRRRWDSRSFSPSGLLEIVRMGAPMSLHSAIEAWGFTAAMMMAGWMGTEALGAHQITLNLTALAFMVPLGIAIGGATRVGNLIGAGDSLGARRAFGLALRLALLWSAVAAPAFFFFRHSIAAVFSSDPEIVASVATLTCFVALFQPLDAAHAVGAGVLRGMGRPGVPALVNFVGFAVGLPLAHWFGVRSGHGILAIWCALTLRLTFVAAGVSWWARRTARRPLDELTVMARA